MRTKIIIFVSVLLFLTLLIPACINYMLDGLGSSFVGNKPAAIGSVSSKSNSELVYKYVDSLYKYYPEYALPEEWKDNYMFQKDKASHLDLAFFYFKSDPEEIHELQFSGMIYHNSVSKIRDGKLYIMYGEGARNNNETERILSRIEKEIFPKIERLISGDTSSTLIENQSIQ